MSETKPKLTLPEVIRRAYKEQPRLKLAVGRSNEHGQFTAIGAWDKGLGRYVMVAGLMLDGSWANMPMELLIDGKPIIEKWLPVPKSGLLS